MVGCGQGKKYALKVATEDSSPLAATTPPTTTTTNSHPSLHLAPHLGPTWSWADKLQIHQVNAQCKFPKPRDKPQGWTWSHPQALESLLSLSHPDSWLHDELIHFSPRKTEVSGQGPIWFYKWMGWRPSKESGEENYGSNVMLSLKITQKGSRSLKNSPKPKEKSNLTLKI